VKSIRLAIRQLAQRRSGDKISKQDASSARDKAESVQRPGMKITRDVFYARLTCPSQAIRGTHQTTYRNHSISTTQSQNGMWVAAFGRLDGQMMEIESSKYAVFETPMHEGETLAIADAQVQIDDRVLATC